jgi:transposase
MQSYSQDLRDRVLRALARGEGPSSIAERFEVSRFYVYQVATGNKRPGSGTVFRSAGIAALGWKKQNRLCGAGLQPSQG